MLKSPKIFQANPQYQNASTCCVLQHVTKKWKILLLSILDCKLWNKIISNQEKKENEKNKDFFLFKKVWKKININYVDD